eukprot:PhF_6_TR11740/c0_g3_i1/m.19190
MLAGSLGVSRLEKKDINPRRWKPRETVFAAVCLDGVTSQSWKKRMLEGSLRRRSLLLWKCDAKGERVKFEVLLDSIHKVCSHGEAKKGSVLEGIPPAKKMSFVGRDTLTLRRQLERINDLGVVVVSMRVVLYLLFDTERNVEEFFYWFSGSHDETVQRAISSCRTVAVNTAIQNGPGGSTDHQDEGAAGDHIQRSAAPDQGGNPSNMSSSSPSSTTGGVIQRPSLPDDDLQQLRWLLHRNRRDIQDVVLEIQNTLTSTPQMSPILPR